MYGSRSKPVSMISWERGIPWNTPTALHNKNGQYHGPGGYHFFAERLQPWNVDSFSGIVDDFFGTSPTSRK